MKLRESKRIIWVAVAVVLSLSVVAHADQGAVEKARAAGLIGGSVGNIQREISRAQFCELVMNLHDVLLNIATTGGGTLDQETVTDSSDAQTEQEQDPVLYVGDDPNEEDKDELQEQLDKEAGELVNRPEMPALAEGGNLDINTPARPEMPALAEGGDVDIGDHSAQAPTDQAAAINSFTDTNNPAVIRAAERGLVSGVTATQFMPNNPISLQDACVVLTRLVGAAIENSDITLATNTVFMDNWKIGYWAKSAVNYMHYHKIINDKDGHINPTKNLTMDEAIQAVLAVHQNKQSFVVPTEIKTEWEWAIEPIYDGLGPDTWFSNGLAAVSINGKYGYINKQGETVIDFEYERGYSFSEGMARVVKGGKTGFIDLQGKIVIPIEYDSAGDFSQGHVWLQKGGKYGFANAAGEITELEYDYAYDYKEGLAAVKKDKLYGYIDFDGQTVIDFKFPWASSFSEGLARVGARGEYDYIDKSGNIALDLKYDYLFDFKEGHAVVVNIDQYAMINKKGEVTIPFSQFGLIFGLSEGLTKVHSHAGYEGNYGFVDSAGNSIISRLPLQDANDFNEGLSPVATHTKKTDTVTRSYMNKQGNFVYPMREALNTPTEYDQHCFYLHRFSEGLAAVVNHKGKLGFISNPLLSK